MCSKALYVLVVLLSGVAAGVAAAAPPMRLTIPKALKAPTIDGKLSAGEWDDAAAVTGVINQFDGLAHPRQATFWVKYDEKNLYVAQRSTLLPGEKDTPHRAPGFFFEEDNENYIVIGVAPGRPNTGDDPSNYTIWTNISGKFYMNPEIYKRLGDKSVLSVSNPSSIWQHGASGPEPQGIPAANSFREEDTIWESEYALSLSSIKVDEDPSGETWGLLLARDYPMLDQNAIVQCEKGYRFGWLRRDWRNIQAYNLYHEASEYAVANLRAGAPAVQVLDLGDLYRGRVEPRVAVMNTGKEATTVTITRTLSGQYGLGGLTPPAELRVALAPGERKEVVFARAPAAPGTRYNLTLTVKDNDGGTLYHQTIPFRPGYGADRVKYLPDLYFSGHHRLGKWTDTIMSCYNPIHNLLVGRIYLGDNPAIRDRAARAELAVRRRREDAPFFTTAIDPKMAMEDSHEAKLPELTPGVYEVTANVYDKADKLIARARDLFIRFDHEKDLPWLGNTIGVSDRVLEPWTPIERDGDSLRCWGREYRIDGSGLLTGVQAVAGELLAAPMRVEIMRNGQQLAIQAGKAPQDVQVREHQAQWSGQLTADGWKITTRAEMDYDGYVLYRLRLEPKGRQKVDALRLVIPLRPEEATHLHAAGGVWMRGAVSSVALPRKAGRLWSSLNPGSPDISALRVGSFKPYVWVGGAHRGLAFMADSDEGWVPDGGAGGKKHGKTPSIEVVGSPDGKTVSLVLNLVARPFTFTKPREITFSLQATPIRPLDKDARELLTRVRMRYAFPGSDPDGWANDGQQFFVGENRRNYIGGHGSAPFPLNWDRNIQYRKQIEARGDIFTPYQAMDHFFIHPEVEDPRVPGIQGVNYYGYLMPEFTSTVEMWDANMDRTEMEYRLWRYQRWIRDAGIQGIYFDMTMPCLSANLPAGHGYRLDLPDRPALHGRVQPGYLVTGIREFLKRLRTVFVEEGKRPCVWLHVTDAYMLSAFGFADIFLAGENTPDKKTPWLTDFKHASPQRMQTAGNAAKWGIPTNWLWMNKAPLPAGHKSPKWGFAVRSWIGWLGLHDIAIDRVDMQGPTRYLEETQSDDFLPYWDPKVSAALKVLDQTDVFASGWRQNNSLLLLCYNRGKETLRDVVLKVDAKALGLRTQPEEPLTVVDVEPRRRDREDWNLNATHKVPWERKMSHAVDETDVTITMDIKDHNYRLLRVSYAQE